MENWKDIKGYEGLYKVSSYGRIMTVRKKAILCPAKTISNGLTVSLSKNGKSKTKQISRLVANAFIPNPDNKPYVDHIDGVRYHNFVENLRWCTQKENMNYELEIIRDVLKPQPQQCYRNAHLLCQLFPERVQYCEDKVLAFFPIEHAFNRVGDKYVDITFEFALNDTELLQHEYVVFGEYDLQTINRVTKETGYYGDIYRNVYIERVKDNPRRNEVTPGVGTQ